MTQEVLQDNDLKRKSYRNINEKVQGYGDDYRVAHAWHLYATLKGDREELDTETLFRAFNSRNMMSSEKQLIDLLKKTESNIDAKQSCDSSRMIPFDSFIQIYDSIRVHDEVGNFLESWLKLNQLYQLDQNLEAEAKPQLHPLYDFAAGTVAGLTITLVGHPFDTVKTRLQTSYLFSGGIDCAYKTLKHEGPRGLYKGMGGPLVTVPLINAIIFGSYGFARRSIQSFNGDTNKELTVLQHSLAGAFAGVANAFVVCPIELVKTRLQTQYTSNKRIIQYSGPFDCAMKIYNQKGLRGLYRGMWVTVIREIPGYGGQFASYELAKRYFSTGTFKEIDENNLTPVNLMLSGAIAGLGAWIGCYPMDVVKSVLQAEKNENRYKKSKVFMDGGFFSCLKEIVRHSGWKGLWRGFGTCTMRALPANAAGFLGYEATLKLLQS